MRLARFLRRAADAVVLFATVCAIAFVLLIMINALALICRAVLGPVSR